MSAPTIAYDVRYRPAGDTEHGWQTRQFAASEAIQLTELGRGVAYEIQVRSVAASGRSSAWVDASVQVANTNRLGAAALPNIANQQAMWDIDTAVSYAASSDAAGVSTATITVSGGTLVIGSMTVSYGGSSASISGTAGTSRTVFLYYDDPQLVGGTLPLGIADNIVASANVDGRVAISSVSLAFPAAGSSSTGGGGIGGGGGSGGSRPNTNLQAV
ncbi:hypothetical protein Xmar_07695 [Xanthomonas axonopodis pv. martyniicola]|uniref:hypothetical protein n=1 Tax=Xanthomonas axonopodis TaxID=53413 RepID=UPI000996EA82|nr:hypothetical protein [Xanthomonas axonopodis]OOW67086.1 hypothetical protein Xmar_07695 [Xanthomonas axonopodis pv. martyniicola]OOW90161.1 hypothetical protein Xvtr_19140 [Xanthomonas campestris pv. vitiscarnosae]